jgi:lipopolysaccharide export LptBFGC system permease protein LptF
MFRVRLFLVRSVVLLARQAALQFADFLHSMRISDRYIGSQVFFGTLYAIVVLSLVLVLGNLFKEIRPLLVDQRAPLDLVLRFVISVLPVSLMYTLPWGFLSAVLLVFGRLSSAQEITALRVAGVSLFRLAAPVFVLGALLSAVSLWLNVNVVPLSKGTLEQLLYEQAARDPESLIRPGVSELGRERPVKMLIESKDSGWVNGFHLFLFSEAADVAAGESPMGARASTYIYASRAALAVLRERSQLRAKLENAYYESRGPDGDFDMAFSRAAEPIMIDLKNPRARRIRTSEMTNVQILKSIRENTEMTNQQRVKLRSEITQRQSFSMACFAFAFIAVPLGLKSRRKDTSSGLLMSLGLGGGYFLFTVIADEFETTAGATATLWAPNVLCVLLGLILFRRARFK